MDYEEQVRAAQNHIREIRRKRGVGDDGKYLEDGTDWIREDLIASIKL